MLTTCTFIRTEEYKYGVMQFDPGPLNKLTCIESIDQEKQKAVNRHENRLAIQKIEASIWGKNMKP